MKILLIAMSNSIHTAGYVKQIAGMGWDVRLFPSLDCGVVHPELNCIPVYHTLGGQKRSLGWKLHWQRQRLYAAARGFLGNRLLPKLWPQRRVLQLSRIIEEFQPDIVHSLEFQAAGYLTLAVRQLNPVRFPPWMVTAWGSDIYHFRQFPEHEAKIRQILRECDYFSCDCQRDICLAKAYGLKGFAFPARPFTKGFDFKHVDKLRQPGLVSKRRIIMLKGYQHFVGRSLVGLAALEKCIDLLSEYEIVVYAVSNATARAAKKMSKKYGIRLTLLPASTPYDEILKMHGSARVSIGLSLSDGASISFLEAMVMGSFPIQSWTACADEWIKDGKSGLLVPPEDVNTVVSAVRRALTDDLLVETAAEINAMTSKTRLDHRQLREMSVDYYRTIACDKGIACSD